MALYQRVRGELIEMTAEQVKDFRAVKEVDALKRAVIRNNGTLRALAKWLLTVHKKGNKMVASDLVVARLPNIDRLLSMADEAEHAYLALDKRI